MSDIRVRSVYGEYGVQASSGDLLADLQEGMARSPFVVLDSRVEELHGELLAPVLDWARHTFRIDATEDNKTVATAVRIVESLLDHETTKVDPLLVVGGGIVQDVAAFAAGVALRGIPWVFVPTTLLSMCDSAVGSKCGINLGGYKNQVGIFYPPADIVLDSRFLDTLDIADIYSGIGEILKVHVIDGDPRFSALEDVSESLLSDKSSLLHLTMESLRIKKEIVEVDEFDLDYRHVLNYGHSFGHALEAYTNNEIPHGVAVTIGMEIANHLSLSRRLISTKEHERLSRILRRFAPVDSLDLSDVDRMAACLRRDKKFDGETLGALLCEGVGKVKRVRLQIDDSLLTEIAEFGESWSNGSPETT